MNHDLLNAAREVFSNPIAVGVVGAGAVIGLWKGAKALAKHIREENERNAIIQANIAELQRVVTPIKFPPPRP